MDAISAPIPIRISAFSCCATRIGAATDRETVNRYDDERGRWVKWPLLFSANEQRDEDRCEQTVSDELCDQHFNEELGMAGDHVPREEHAKKSRNDRGNHRRSSVRHVAPQAQCYFCGAARMLPQGSTFCCLTSGSLLIVDW